MRCGNCARKLTEETVAGWNGMDEPVCEKCMKVAQLMRDTHTHEKPKEPKQ